MPGASAGAAEFRALALRLKAAGEGGLRRDLYQAIDDAAQPLAREIASPAHLYPYMPDPYARVLASDLSVSVSKLAGEKVFGVRLIAKGRVHARKVKRLDQGLLTHPVFASAGRPRRQWKWVTQRASVKAGFFSDPAQKSAPAVRDRITAAMHYTAMKITKG